MSGYPDFDRAQEQWDAGTLAGPEEEDLSFPVEATCWCGRPLDERDRCSVHGLYVPGRREP